MIILKTFFDRPVHWSKKFIKACGFGLFLLRYPLKTANIKQIKKVPYVKFLFFLEKRYKFLKGNKCIILSFFPI